MEKLSCEWRWQSASRETQAQQGPCLFLPCIFSTVLMCRCECARVCVCLRCPSAGSSFNDYKTGTKPEENKRANDTSKRKRTERRGKVRCRRVNRLERTKGPGETRGKRLTCAGGDWDTGRRTENCKEFTFCDKFQTNIGASVLIPLQIGASEEISE